jgi:hypothetical protein
MLAVRALLAIAMIGVGAFIIARMLPYPIAQTYTGMVLGGAMILLGVFRLRQIIAVRRAG